MNTSPGNLLAIALIITISIIHKASSYTSGSPKFDTTTTSWKLITPICMDVQSVPVKLSTCLQWHLFLVPLLLPSTDNFSDIIDIIRSIREPCSLYETQKQLKSLITYIGTETSAGYGTKPITLDIGDRQQEDPAFLTRYAVETSNIDLVNQIKNSVLDVMYSMQEECKALAIYVVTNIPCSVLISNYTKIIDELATSAPLAITNSQIPVRVLWLNSNTSAKQDCYMDQMCDRALGWFYWKSIDSSTSLRQLSSQFGLCPGDYSPDGSIQSTTPKPKEGNNNIIGIVLGVGLTALILGLVIIRIILKIMRPDMNMWTWMNAHCCFGKFKIDESSKLIAMGSQRPPTQGNNYQYPQFSKEKFSSDKWEIDPLSLQISSEKLGSGAYAVVFKGTLRGTPPVVKVFPTMQLAFTLSETENPVAVKIAHSHASNEDKQDFLQEISFMKKLEYHSHILGMVGCSMDPEFPLIVTELCECGDLLHLLNKFNKSTSDGEECILEFSDLLPMAWQISDALSFLSSKKIVHRDVAARNVLVKKTKLVKLSDFGLCRNIDSMFYSSKGGKLPIKWMAPESLQYAQFSTETDVITVILVAGALFFYSNNGVHTMIQFNNLMDTVFLVRNLRFRSFSRCLRWSYGVFLYELFSFGNTPYPTIQAENMLQYLNEGNRMEPPDEAPIPMKKLMVECWCEDRYLRPKFCTIKERIYNILEADSLAYGYLQFSQEYCRIFPSLLPSPSAPPQDNNDNHSDV